MWADFLRADRILTFRSFVQYCSVLEASNGAEALDIINHTRPDLVLTDRMMPVMDGFVFFYFALWWYLSTFQLPATSYHSATSRYA